jgi:putative ABC transport system ATP-binding protein
VCLAGTGLDGLSEVALTDLRRHQVGFVFQAFNLLPALTVEQNLTLPTRRAGRRPGRAWMREVARRTGLDEHLEQRPADLSGGQQQRVAIARALVMWPALLFADEPTGALDAATGREVLQLLRDCVVELGFTIVMVTRDPVAASYADAVLFLAGGRIVDHHAPPAARRGRRPHGPVGAASPLTAPSGPPGAVASTGSERVHHRHEGHDGTEPHVGDAPQPARGVPELHEVLQHQAHLERPDEEHHQADRHLVALAGGGGRHGGHDGERTQRQPHVGQPARAVSLLVGSHLVAGHRSTYRRANRTIQTTSTMCQ